MSREAKPTPVDAILARLAAGAGQAPARRPDPCAGAKVAEWDEVTKGFVEQRVDCSREAFTGMRDGALVRYGLCSMCIADESRSRARVAERLAQDTDSAPSGSRMAAAQRKAGG